jgi:hypothetical protein
MFPALAESQCKMPIYGNSATYRGREQNCWNIIFKRNFPIQLFERSCELGLWRLTADKKKWLHCTYQLNAATFAASASRPTISRNIMHRGRN